MTSKKYSYAAAQLAHQKYNHLFALIKEDASVFDPRLVEFIFNQLMIKAATRFWGNHAIAASAKEMK